MALEFPSWLEWLSWLVGSEWPHGNEDRMWQMARDLESVAGQSDELIDELTRLMDDIKKAYPDGVGGESALQWLQPLRDGDSSGHGSVKEFGDNYRQLSKAADQMGDSLQGAKINFYIAGAFLLAELAWAAATGPFAGFFETEAMLTARTAFRTLGKMLEGRIESLIERQITNEMLKEIVVKAVYEVGKGAFISTAQSVGQELAVQTIQNLDGRGHGYDWGAIGKNAVVSAFSGAAGGAAGFGMNRAFPTTMGGWRGAFNGALDGAVGGLGGAGAAWLGNGVVNGNWELDPRSLTGGAFAGAGPGGLLGWAGETNHNGPRDVPTRDGSTTVVTEPHTTAPTLDRPGAGPESHPGTTGGPTTDGTAPHGTNGAPTGGTNGAHPEGANGGHPEGTNGAASDGNSQGGGRDGGPSLHPASAPDAVNTDQAPPPEHGNDSHPTDNQAPVWADSRRERPDLDAQNDAGATDSAPQRGSDTHAPGAGTTGDTSGGDAHAGGQHPATGDHADPAHGGNGDPSGHADSGSNGDPSGHAGSGSNGDPSGHADSGGNGRIGGDADGARPTADPGAEPNRLAAGPVPMDAGSSAHSGPGGEPGRGAPAGSGTTPPAHAAGPTSEARPAADPAKATPLPRDLRAGAPLDGTAPKPVGTVPESRAAAADRPFRAGTDPVQAARTGVEKAGPNSADGTGETVPAHHEPDVHEPAGAHPVGEDHTPRRHDEEPGSQDRATDSRDHTSGGQDHATGGRDHAAGSQDHSTGGQDHAVGGRDHAFADPDHAPGASDHGSGERDSQSAPQAGLPDAGPVPVHLPGPHESEAPRNPSDNRRSGVPAAAPVGDFHGDARPEGKPLSQDDVDGQVDHNLRLITPEDVRWNRNTREFVLPNGDTVRIEVTDTAPPAEGGKRDVAQIHERPGGYDIHISPRARTEDVARAVAHELAEIRLAQEDDIPISRPDMREDRPDAMTPHLAGRFAELKVLAASVDRAVMDPATKAGELSRLRNDLHDLTQQLGFHDPAHEATVKQLLHEHDPVLAHRIGLQEHDILGHRPTFGPSLDEHGFAQGAHEHLDQLGQHLTGEHAPDTLRAEEQGLHGRMREELSRRIFDPIFDPATRTARKTWDGLLEALNPLSAVINDPSLSPRDRAAALHQAIDDFRSHPDMTPQVRDAIGDNGFQHMHDAAQALADGPNHVTGVLDTATGRLVVDGRETTLGEFLQGVDRANRGATENGLNVEYTVVLHDPVDGQSAVEVMPRPRPQHRLPMEQTVFGPNHEPLPREERPSLPAAVEGGHTVDVGVGRGAYALELTPAADRSHGGLVVKTELASEFAGAAQRRRDLGILDPGPLTEPGTVMVFGDLLTNGHLLADGTGEPGLARIYINNVSAHLNPSEYHGMAERLRDALKPGGRIEIQWDTKPENTEEPFKYRGHITGPELMRALDQMYPEGANPFRIVEETTIPEGQRNYDYTIDTGASNNLNRQRMAGIIPPEPDHRMVIAYEPHGEVVAAVEPHASDAPSPETIEAEYGIPQENQQKIQAYADEHGLIIDVRPTNPDAVDHLRDGAMPKPMSIKDKTINAADIALGAPPEAKGLVGRFEPGQLRMPEGEDLTPEREAALQKRLGDRENDYRAYSGYMDDLVAQGKFRVTADGVLEGRVGDEFKPVTGDHDLFDIRHPDGTPLTPEELRTHENALMNRDAGIQHGPHVYWEPTSHYQRIRNFEKIIDEHQFDPDPNTKNEPLIRFAPGEQPKVVWADRTVADVDRDMTPWHLESDLSRLSPESQADLERLRQRAFDLAGHPDFDHAKYREWLHTDVEDPAATGTREHLAAMIKREARAGTDPADILRILDSYENPDGSARGGNPEPGDDPQPPQRPPGGGGPRDPGHGGPREPAGDPGEPGDQNPREPHDQNPAEPHDKDPREPHDKDPGAANEHSSAAPPHHDSRDQRNDDMRDLRAEARSLRQAGMDSVGEMTGKHPALKDEWRPDTRALVTGRYRSDHDGGVHDSFNYSGTQQEWSPAAEAPRAPDAGDRIFETANASAYDPATGHWADGKGSPRFNDAEAKFFENLVREQLAEHSGLSRQALDDIIGDAIARADAEIYADRPSFRAETKHARHIIEFAVHELNERARAAAPDPSAYTPITARDFSPHQLARFTGLPKDVTEALYPVPPGGRIDTRYTLQHLADHGIPEEAARQVFKESVDTLGLRPDNANHFSKVDVLHAQKRMEYAIEEINRQAAQHAEENGVPFSPITRDSVTGDLRMVVDLPAARTQDMPPEYQICLSCQRVILAYESVFPGMRLEIVNPAGERLHPR
ncbi:hypothetical protein D7D52_28275 [Nocardia yunnanensis]|uniref:Outer membrane channel protein CpnT-like N-terminal domain-containing protein n=1 Tax=Nocardia yunnanensis TaxID=2382165 RepID=A0A386ZHR6_9NOCA|nr:hypothetical protein [Nocardia yunnanensis]AYF77061.1 hypothetical protein D7D52_28275 [Nocardia yunnanensis]